ncbi:2-C-methyl-D-erythritol 4-phosphate cytidylyltransferase [Turneriella parva]|uniref:4-diphosphocytidyl-2C-methyl-D-erythritol synthase n=1 Tax=Turneriella parva (strain ATCC BAA-1111 / DSM 21527 / NCTC 11395 / H) TaxID=869212 RepID=I4B5B8_TURPD|nr:2-C-methyl-D-erythritol 4-phosphate cytidylyltransferase [Turneriella parva]AFM12475.1 4-diphosphocytidyl-2C-methyl-D-erythritol synthase [Turneriella parva DSM 21527]
MNALLLLMGGSGSRFGGPTPKQFLELEHEGVARPLFEVTARKLLAALPIDIAIFVSPKNTAGSAVLNPILEKLAADFPGRQFRYAAAGVTRFGSFLSGINAVRKFQNVERLLVHDANRPYLSGEFLQRVSKHLGLLSPALPAFIPVMPVVDSIVRVDGKNVVTYENRGELNRVQTPQLVHYNTFQEAESRAVARGQLAMDFTDEGSLCLSLGLSVHTFEGDAANVKITYREDLKP